MAQDLLAKKLNFMSRTVTATEAWLNAYADLRQLRQEWDREGYSSSITQANIDLSNLKHLTPTVLGNLMNTYDKINQLIDSTGGSITPDTGYLTNLYNVTS